MDDLQFVILSKYDVADLGWHLGFGAVGGGFFAVGLGVIIVYAWEWAEKKYKTRKKRKQALEGK